MGLVDVLGFELLLPFQLLGPFLVVLPHQHLALVLMAADVLHELVFPSRQQLRVLLLVLLDLVLVVEAQLVLVLFQGRLHSFIHVVVPAEELLLGDFSEALARSLHGLPPAHSLLIGGLDGRLASEFRSFFLRFFAPELPRLLLVLLALLEELDFLRPQPFVVGLLLLNDFLDFEGLSLHFLLVHGRPVFGVLELLCLDLLAKLFPVLQVGGGNAFDLLLLVLLSGDDPFDFARFVWR